MNNFHEYSLFPFGFFQYLVLSLFFFLRKQFLLHFLFLLSHDGFFFFFFSFLPLDYVQLFLLFHAGFVYVYVKSVRQQHWIAALTCTLRIVFSLIPFDCWEKSLSEIHIVSFCQTLCKLGNYQILFFYLHDLLAQEHFELLLLRVIFHTTRFNFWHCFSRKVKRGQIQNSLPAIFLKSQLVEILSILFFLILSVCHHIVGVKARSGLFFANRMFDFHFFILLINCFICLCFILNYRILQKQTWIFK